MSQLPGFIKDKVERLLHEATHPTGMRTNGPTYVRIEASVLAHLLRYAQLEAPAPASAPVIRDDTDHLLSSPANAYRLARSVAQLGADGSWPNQLQKLGYELDGVLNDVKNNGFDEVCLATITRVREALGAAQPAPNACQPDVVDDLAMLVKRLAQALQKVDPHHKLTSAAMVYLNRAGLEGRTLRR